MGGSKLGLPFGLLVSRILGLKRPEQLERRSGSGHGVPWIAAEYHDAAGQAWKRLDMSRLVLHAEFRHAAL
ncbi:MAG: hypothetical protein ACREXU_19460 [Gammaproteobacteria bacterium]